MLGVTEPPMTTGPDIVNANGRGRVLVLCDHASNHIPEDLAGLGLSPRHLHDHIAYDIGAAAVSRRLSELMDTPAVLATVSRLVVDLNRDPDNQDPVPAQSDGIAIPGNRHLSDKARAERLAHYFEPYHQACDRQITAMMARGAAPLVIGVHSFTPVMAGRARPWEIGFLYDRDPRLFYAFKDLLSTRWRFTVGNNEPYSGNELYYTMRRHGERHGHLQVVVEIRQDQIRTEAGQNRWAEILAKCLNQIVAR